LSCDALNLLNYRRHIAKEIAAAEEKRIEMAEKYLEEDAALFDEFLKELVSG
jgi:hypothetical protein